jgi:hypothetical protein
MCPKLEERAWGVHFCSALDGNRFVQAILFELFHPDFEWVLDGAYTSPS